MTDAKFIVIAAAACGALSSGSAAQSEMRRYVLSGGGGTSVGATHTLTGTIGQPIAGPTAGGTTSISAGFWTVPPGGCYPNCDGSTATPTLTPADFVCFLNRFRASDPYANCDGSTGTPTLTPADFVCFLNRFRAGCG